MAKADKVGVGCAVIKRLALCVCLPLFFAPSVEAANHGWYWGVEAGLDQASDAAASGEYALWYLPGPTVWTFRYVDPAEFSLGFVGFATVGAFAAPNFRIEAEAGYRNEQPDGRDRWQELTLMLNGLYDIALSSSLMLSLGGGIGVDAINGEYDDTDTVFAYQGIAGLSYALTPTTELTVKYRLTEIGGPSFSRPLTPFVREFTYNVDKLEHHSVSIGLRFAL
ncbi:MAG: outer membrane beta-barrel protein [Alphaproteobacteria bacterium]|nr:outer membrane beta-barrel protein [Alphaproteobacteria bacterium]